MRVARRVSNGKAVRAISAHWISSPPPFNFHISPLSPKAWNRRATVYYTKKDFGRSLADIHEVLAREPRHFGALSGLGIILQELGDDKHALDAFRRALAIHPHLERLPDLVKKLSEKVDGRDI